MTTICIRRASWLVAWNHVAENHEYVRDHDVVFTDGEIVFVGLEYSGDCDVEVDGRDRLVMPGLINVHAHPASEPLKKGFREEFGNPQMHMSPLYDRAFMLQTDDAGQCIALQYALVELLKSGVTTVVDLSTPYDGWTETLARSGIRAWVVPSFASAHWSTADGHSVEYVWDDARGHRKLGEAVALGEQAEAHPSGRLSTMLSPAQIDTCTEALFRETQAAAADRNWRLHTHAAQSLVEFNEMTRRHGMTPIQWADKIGLLEQNVILGHAMFTDQHSFTHWPGDRDLGLLAESGVGVAHCPTVFARNGQMLEDVGSYLRAGVRLGIGTDSFPHNMLEEMRTSALLARVATGDVGTVSTSEVFHAATVGGADLVGRGDLGRLSVGSRADVVLVDLTHPSMMPIRDPLRSLIYTAADRAICDVFVDGDHVLVDGTVSTIDIGSVTEQLQVIRDQAELDAPKHHFAGRTAREVAPLTLPLA